MNAIALNLYTHANSVIVREMFVYKYELPVINEI